MRNYIIVFLFVAGIFSLASCRSDFEFKASDGKLAFSRDTVYLDTVFTNIGSSTYNLKVYNHSDSDISIPLVTLGKGVGSKYRMTVDGMTGDNGQGKIFHDVELLAKDSLYIFIEVTADVADSNPTDFLYTDQIRFDTGAKQQNVELVTLIQDAIFLYPQKFQDGTTETLTLGSGESAQNIYGFYLDENDHKLGRKADHGRSCYFVRSNCWAGRNDRELSKMQTLPLVSNKATINTSETASRDQAFRSNSEKLKYKPWTFDVNVSYWLRSLFLKEFKTDKLPINS